MDVWLGVAGGGLAELLKWYGIREQLHEGVPKYAKSWLYWIVTVVMVVTGGFLVFVHRLAGNGDQNDTGMNPFLALNVGATAPLILGALTKGFGAPATVD